MIFRSTGKATAGGVLSFLAVGCPYLQQARGARSRGQWGIVLLGAYQPFCAAASAGVLVFAVYQRLRGLKSCPCALHGQGCHATVRPDAASGPSRPYQAGDRLGRLTDLRRGSVTAFGDRLGDAVT